MPKRGLYSNIHAKRKRIKAQKKAGKKPEKIRAKGAKGAPTEKAFRDSKKKGAGLGYVQFFCWY